MSECLCWRCGKVVDPEEAHSLSLGPGPWPMYIYTCQECMEKYGKKCWECEKYFHPSEGTEICSWESGHMDESDEMKRKREYYDGRFLCADCYKKEFPNIPVKDDPPDTKDDMQEDDDWQEFKWHEFD